MPRKKMSPRDKKIAFVIYIEAKNLEAFDDLEALKDNLCNLIRLDAERREAQKAQTENDGPDALRYLLDDDQGLNKSKKLGV